MTRRPWPVAVLGVIAASGALTWAQQLPLSVPQAPFRSHVEAVEVAVAEGLISSVPKGFSSKIELRV